MTYTTIQFRLEDLERIKQLREQLEKNMGIKLSLAQTVMHSISKK